MASSCFWQGHNIRGCPASVPRRTPQKKGRRKNSGVDERGWGQEEMTVIDMVYLLLTVMQETYERLVQVYGPHSYLAKSKADCVYAMGDGASKPLEVSFLLT